MILERLGKCFDDCVEIGPEDPARIPLQLDSAKLRTNSDGGYRAPRRGVDDVIRWRNSTQIVEALAEAFQDHLHQPTDRHQFVTEM